MQLTQHNTTHGTQYNSHNLCNSYPSERNLTPQCKTSFSTFICRSIPTSLDVLVEMFTILPMHHLQALLNLKPGRPLQTISYRSLPVNPNNLGKWDASAKQKGKEELGSKDWHHSHYRIWRRGTSPSEITNGMVQVVNHAHLHLFIKSIE